jgi:hypothetical protein
MTEKSLTSASVQETTTSFILECKIKIQDLAHSHWRRNLPTYQRQVKFKLWHQSAIGTQRNTLIPVADIRENHLLDITPDTTPSSDKKNAEYRYRKDPRNE